MGPSLGRLQLFRAHANTVPATGNLLVREGERYVAKVRFTGANWSEVVVPLANNEARAADLSQSAGFTISYSATAELWVQIRGTVQPHGGDQHVVRLAPTGGQVQTRSFRFVPEEWTQRLGPPRVTLADVVKSAIMFNFIGIAANDVTVTSLRFDSYAPMCL